MAEFLTLKDPKVKTTLIILGVAILLYLLIGSWLNNIHNADKTVQNNFASLKQNCDHRVSLLPQFADLLIQVAPQAQDLSRQLTQAYVLAVQSPITEQILTEEVAQQTFVSTQMAVTNAFSLLMLQANSVPELAHNRQFLVLKMTLQSQEQQINYVAAILNQSILVYNSYLAGYPKNWLNSLFLGDKQKQLVQVSTLIEHQRYR